MCIFISFCSEPCMELIVTNSDKSCEWKFDDEPVSWSFGDGLLAWIDKKSIPF